MTSSKNNANMYLVMGYVASGKTTVSDKLADVTGIEQVIRTDDIRKELFPREFDYNAINLTDPLSVDSVKQWIDANDVGEIDFQEVLNPLGEIDGGEYREIFEMYGHKIEEQKKMVYQTAFQRLNERLSQGQDVIFDAAFSKKEMRERAYDAARDNGIDNIYVVQVVCSEDVVKERLEARAMGCSETLTSNAKQMKVYCLVKEEFDESRIEADNPENIALRRIVYHTDTNYAEMFGEHDDESKRIMTDVIDVLIEKYGVKN